MKILVVVLVVIGLMAGATFGEKPGRIPTKVPVVKSVASKSYYIGEREHLVIMDIPDKFVPRRCLVYVNEVTHTTNMNCNFDDAGAPFPLSEQE